MREVVITGYLRTAQSRSRPKDPARDWLHGFRADGLLARLLPEVLQRGGVNPAEVDDFIVGCSTGVAENWTYGGRFPIFLADLPQEIPAKCVDQQCGSSMAALHIGFMEIATGNADVVLVGGMEHMTRVPQPGRGLAEEALVIPPELLEDERYRHWDMLTSFNMGLTAEKLAVQSGISRDEMDRWAVRSHQLAAQGYDQGFFDGEILPLEAPQGDGTTRAVNRDQAVRADANLEGTAGLKPAFSEDGVITAGNSSPLNAGATSMVLMSRETADKKGVAPLAAIRAIASAGVDPTIMGQGPVPSSQKALARAGLEAKDIDYWEINEAFAVVPLNCIKELGIDPSRVNVMGGGLAIGHPLGATGLRLVGTLGRILALKGGRLGLANACIG
ncbi:MAG: acetyl-CoA C-acetyltransferase, partial [Proteobacteria bacterium]|nr:acetyl-CoA C-acetyltransferase [Pseudomonadota bacterium]